MHRVRMFKHFGVTPYLVFDGDYLPSKAATEASREARREASKKAGEELLRAGKPSKAYQEFQKAIDVTPEMARLLIEELKKNNIPFVVAPYEADSQLVYLERHGMIGGIVSEDSDLLVFGAKRLLTKLDQHGQCIEISRKDFCAVREISLTQWTDVEFRHMAILSGCDYLDGINGVGLKTAYRLIRKHRTPERVVKMLQFEGNTRIPDNYLADFKQAELTFLYQRVFCPKLQDIVHLTELDASVDIASMPFIGPPVDTALARAIAVGDVNPITKKHIILPAPPGKRRISQVFGPMSKPLGKPINEYFSGNRRIPLGEMDPNCFNVEVQDDDNVTQAAPRPLVFPLPRPYLDDAATPASPARRYKAHSSRRQSEPISNLLESFAPETVPRHRRRTTGPAIQVYQDADTSTRPPKKARLCEDLPIGNSGAQTPERSRFFSDKPKKSASKKEKAHQYLMSDDSIDEAFRSLPDVSIGISIGSSKRLSREVSKEMATFQEIMSDEETLPSGSITKNGMVDDDIEVPASSPLQKLAEKATQQGPSKTPLGEKLQMFGYKSTSRTKIVHGLPTPSSSQQKPSRTPTQLPGPMLTPLQRIGSQALHRGKGGSMSFGTQRTSVRDGRLLSGFVRANPASVPLPKMDLAEVEALNRPCGSEDQIIPDSDGESDMEDPGQSRRSSGRSCRRFND